MKRLLLLPLLLVMLCMPVSATEFTAPTVPESGERYMPEVSESFGKDLWYIITRAFSDLRPDITGAIKCCVSVIAVCMLLSFFENLTGRTKQILNVVTVIAIGILLLEPAQTMIYLGKETVASLSDYNKLLLPVMSSALAAQGGTSSAAALYIGTVAFDALLTTLIAKILVPLVYVYIFISLSKNTVKEPLLVKLGDFCKWLITWGLKTLLYVFTGFMSITNVVCGTVDASAMKAAKLTISGAVPVVGSILSDASESLIVGVGFMKSTAGVYGILAALSICIGPFLKIGTQYLLLKLTSGTCSLFSSKETQTLVNDFSGAMGFLLAMTGTVCLMVFISTVCFMKGVS